MEKSFSSFIRQQFDLECLLCFQEYDNHKKEPTEVCSNHHFFCQQCVRSQKFKKDIKNCPICRQNISQTFIKPVKAYVFIEKIKCFILHQEQDKLQILEKLKRTEDYLTQNRIILQRTVNKEKKLQLQNEKLQRQIQKLTKQMRQKQQNLVSKKPPDVQTQTNPTYSLIDGVLTQRILNTQKLNGLNNFQNPISYQKKRRQICQSTIQQNEQLELQKKPCKVCSVKHSILCFGIICLKCYKKPKI